MPGIGELEMKMETVWRLLSAGACLVLASEGAVRWSGAVDFPIYAIDSGIGYIPAPNQSGKFLNKNVWVFNDRSMGTEAAWNPNAKPNLLLIGNSIVMGGNPYDQADKLGPLLQTRLGDKIAVWSIAAGAWSNVNETVYLQRNPDVVKAASFFVWEYMNGGFSQLSPDRGQYVFPHERPLFASWYVLRRYVLPRFIDFNMDELPPKGATQSENVQQFESMVAKLATGSGAKVSGILFFYPGREEYIGMKNGKDYVPDRQALERIAARYKLKTIDIAKQPDWNLDNYREGTHPTVEGNRVLADILARAVRQAQ
jgi:lysophospholipase L1-like esterase